MIRHSAFAVEPWAIRETRLDLDLLAQTESLFALANGHVGLRGNLDEGEPFGLPGTYLNSVFELRPIPYGETAYGNPESGQTVINVTDGKLIYLLVDDEPFDVRYGELDREGQFRIDGVTGPDEYSALADNNIYTNLMAQQNLRGAADFAERQPARGRALGVDEAEIAEWRRAAGAIETGVSRYRSRPRQCRTRCWTAQPSR